MSRTRLHADHTTVWRWVQRYGPELEQRMRRHLKPTNKSWRVDETYIRVQGRWCYLYRAIDSAGATIDFLLLFWVRPVGRFSPDPHWPLFTRPPRSKPSPYFIAPGLANSI